MLTVFVPLGGVLETSDGILKKNVFLIKEIRIFFFWDQKNHVFTVFSIFSWYFFVVCSRSLDKLLKKYPEIFSKKIWNFSNKNNRTFLLRSKKNNDFAVFSTCSWYFFLGALCALKTLKRHIQGDSQISNHSLNSNYFTN